MSARSGIAKGLASVIGTSLNGTGIYVNNIYDKVNGEQHLT